MMFRDQREGMMYAMLLVAGTNAHGLGTSSSNPQFGRRDREDY
jgi:hypothetical protein